MKHGKRYAAAAALIERQRAYSIDEAIEKMKASATAGFDETAEIAINLGIKPSQTIVRGTCTLPHGTGKTVRILAFAKGEAQKEAEEAGADYVGGEDLAKKIQEGWLDFDKVVATPDMMPVVGKLGKILGPRGLMPSPKTGTVTKDIGRVIRELKKGMVEFRTDRYGVIHSVFGKVSFDKEALRENLIAFVRSVLDRRPEEGVKGRYIKKVAISSTMGPGITLDLGELLQAAEEAG
ncbi:MAG TPA: 50S ribosomal protein L1 [Candidatus Acetothermia bacterium]|nr:50S ribosomal protein L1 [Candidatus Bipolaricaulota bacterium]HDJ29765.1 50S ribosomal protein L1 [Candidatus Acetothermia bacterium]